MGRSPGRIKPLEKLEQLKQFLNGYQMEEHHAGDPGYGRLSGSAVCLTVVNPNPNPDPEHLASGDLCITLSNTGMAMVFAEVQVSFHNVRDHFAFLEELSIGILEDRFCAAVLYQYGEAVFRRLVLSERASADPVSVFGADEAAALALAEGPCEAAFTHWDRRETIPMGSETTAEA